jgi:cytochrome c oxidase subunit III
MASELRTTRDDMNELEERVEEFIDERPVDEEPPPIEEVHMPPPSMAPLILGVGTTLLLVGIIAPPLLVVGGIIAVVGLLRMASFPDFELHAHWFEQLDTRKLGMWAFLASEVMFFTALIGTFIRFKVNQPEIFAEAQAVLNLPLATVGTTILIVSSFAVVMGLEALQSNSRKVFFNWMGLTLLFGLAFVSIQAFEWYELIHEGIKTDNLFGTTFFVTTGFHGLHVLLGVAWLALLLLRARRGIYSAQNYLGVEMFGLYWHFVDIVWIVLFTIIYLID